MCVAAGPVKEPVCGLPCSLFPPSGNAPDSGCSVLGDPRVKMTEQSHSRPTGANSYVRNKALLL